MNIAKCRQLPRWRGGGKRTSLAKLSAILQAAYIRYRFVEMRSQGLPAFALTCRVCLYPLQRIEYHATFLKLLAAEDFPLSSGKRDAG